MFFALILAFMQYFASGQSGKGQAILLIIEIIAGIVIGFFPVWVANKLNFQVPRQLYAFFITFLFASVYLGTLQHFYRFAFWDKGLHLVSSSLEVCLGLALFAVLVTPEIQAKISRTFVIFYAFCFSLLCGVLWEFYEFTCDSFGMNLQRYMLNGHPKVGRGALMDTMTDLLCDFAGALLFCIYLYFKFRKDPGSLKTFFFNKKSSMDN